ncbi:PP2C-like domain-containing protein CG9801 isoform X1 [Octopus bimaculoides]|uniref:PP2C-like domain-containing protein CG9801 isoform X1 n=1 Tax=Octopus bimaculoides TaxID=37653 RepID=UPI0022E5BD71|nr:PP2C-like domain-containing protein CG9801 isoform X1 [Octopus bimaculoides]
MIGKILPRRVNYEYLLGQYSTKFDTEIWHGRTHTEVPLVRLAEFSEELFASYSGPDLGLACEEVKNCNDNFHKVAGAQSWNKKDQRAYGLCISLYDQHPIYGKMSGDPIADAFAICCRKNNAIMLIADGVNWGEKSRLAARCALYGSMEYINRKLFQEKTQPASTQEALEILRTSMDAAHRTILKKEGGLTTLCVCLICPVYNSADFAVCCVNVGDSFAYVFSKNNGIREITVGSHDVASERDIRDAGGAIGPVDGENPELQNLTCSLTFVNKGDVVFLTTDGISDNFDPVVTKVAIPRKNTDNNSNDALPTTPDTFEDKPMMEPQERHIYALKEMERIIHEHELLTEETCSAQELCGALVQHVLTLTDSKRKILENPELYRKKKMTSKERKRRDSQIVEQMSKAPGKLDHASIVAYEVGICGEDEEEEEIELIKESNSVKVKEVREITFLPFNSSKKVKSTVKSLLRSKKKNYH